MAFAPVALKGNTNKAAKPAVAGEAPKERKKREPKKDEQGNIIPRKPPVRSERLVAASTYAKGLDAIADYDARIKNWTDRVAELQKEKAEKIGAFNEAKKKLGLS